MARVRGEVMGTKPFSSRDPARPGLQVKGDPAPQDDDVDEIESDDDPHSEDADDEREIEPIPHNDPHPTGSTQKASIRGPLIARATYSIREFCAAHRISTDFYFKLKRQGLAPKEMRVGSRVLISVESAAAWRAEREVAAPISQSTKAPEVA